MSTEDAGREWIQGPQQGGVEFLPFFLPQNGTTGIAEASLVSVPFQEGRDKAEVGLTGWVQLNLKSDCCQETSLGSNLYGIV